MSDFRRPGAEILSVIERTGDPGAQADRILVYGKDVVGVTQLFAQSSDGTVHQLTPIDDATAVLAFGNNSVAASADTRFLDQWGSTTTAGLLQTTPIVAPRSGVLRNLFVRHQAAVGNGNSVEYTVLINGVVTTITVTLATGTVTQASDLINTAAVVQGDRITLRAVKALALGNGAVIPSVTLELI